MASADAKLGQALPLYDLFLDLPHPAAAAACPPPYVLGNPVNNPEMEKELSANMSRISRFAFPEFDDSMASRIPRDGALNRFSQYAMQPKGFQNYTFSLQLQSGVRMHGFVRRYLPIHPVAKYRYDVGRRGERALVILTRFSGGDLVYAAILKYVLLHDKYSMSSFEWLLMFLFVSIAEQNSGCYIVSEASIGSRKSAPRASKMVLASFI
jgi:hypothetical protein